MNGFAQSPPPRNNAAVLIDGDNAQPSLVDKILLEVSRYARPTIRRIYGDWTASNMGSWKLLLHDHAICPVQQFRNTVGKNATDSAMIIDAMDILNSRVVRCFCIVSSDSDFTRLATRIREDGVMVIGVGKRSTPQAFVKACDVFIHTENLVEPEEVAATVKVEVTKQVVPAIDKPDSAAGPVKPVIPALGTSKAAKVAVVKPKAAAPVKKKSLPPSPMLLKAFQMSVQDDGWAHLSGMGVALREIDPAFDSRTWGHSQLSQLMQAAAKEYELKRAKGPGAGGVFVKWKGTAKAKGK